MDRVALTGFNFCVSLLSYFSLLKSGNQCRSIKISMAFPVRIWQFSVNDSVAELSVMIWQFSVNDSVSELSRYDSFQNDSVREFIVRIWQFSVNDSVTE